MPQVSSEVNFSHRAKCEWREMGESRAEKLSKAEVTARHCRSTARGRGGHSVFLEQQLHFKPIGRRAHKAYKSHLLSIPNRTFYAPYRLLFVTNLIISWLSFRRTAPLKCVGQPLIAP